LVDVGDARSQAEFILGKRLGEDSSHIRQTEIGPPPRCDEGLRQDGLVQVTLLYFDGCPNWTVADERLRAALDQTGNPDVNVTHRKLSTPREAESIEFRGSPTILIDGRDPFLIREAPVGLSCRVYRTEAGLTGAPTVEQLARVLQ
jgi:hypothetical protein